MTSLFYKRKLPLSHFDDVTVKNMNNVYVDHVNPTICYLDE